MYSRWTVWSRVGTMEHNPVQCCTCHVDKHLATEYILYSSCSSTASLKNRILTVVRSTRGKIMFLESIQYSGVPNGIQLRLANSALWSHTSLMLSTNFRNDVMYKPNEQHF